MPDEEKDGEDVLGDSVVDGLAADDAEDVDVIDKGFLVDDGNEEEI